MRERFVDAADVVRGHGLYLATVHVGEIVDPMGQLGPVTDFDTRGVAVVSGVDAVFVHVVGRGHRICEFDDLALAGGECEFGRVSTTPSNRYSIVWLPVSLPLFSTVTLTLIELPLSTVFGASNGEALKNGESYATVPESSSCETMAVLVTSVVAKSTRIRNRSVF